MDCEKRGCVALPNVDKNVKPIEEDVGDLSCNSDVQKKVGAVRFFRFDVILPELEAHKILENKMECY